VSEYTLRQTTPEQITTHWSTCYTHHSSCMERKVEEMTREIQAAEKQAGHFEQLAERMGELNGHMLAEIAALRKAGEALGAVMDINEPDDLLGMLPDEIIAALERVRAENTTLRETLELIATMNNECVQAAMLAYEALEKVRAGKG